MLRLFLLAALPLLAQSISLKPAAWSILYSPGVPQHPSALPGGGWAFSFPAVPDLTCAATSSCPSVNYVITKYTTPITAHYLTMTLRVETTGGAIFNGILQPDNNCVGGDPPRVRFLIWKARLGGGAYDRWWADDASTGWYTLADGTITLTVALVADGMWSSVFGETNNSSAAATAGWQAVLATPGAVGMTFGGNCFLAHGTDISPATATAKFSVLAMSFF